MLLGSRKSLVLAGGVLLTLGLIGSRAQADALNVDILLSGPQAFQETTVQSGQVIWSTADGGLGIQPSNFDVYYGFEIIIQADSDNVPVDPSVSALSLIGWPAEVPETLTWNFEWYPSADGPRNTWLWYTGVQFSSGLTFDPGQVIATVGWATSGDDIDDFPDDGFFEMSASLRIVYMISPNYLLGHLASDSKLLNPEPVPEPGSLIVLAVGSLTVLRRRREVR